MIRLGVNIDHVATLRQVRRTTYPDLLRAAEEAVAGGADLITVHLREDRRHIQDNDVVHLLKHLRVPLNLESSLSPTMVNFACEQGPAWVCLVPENREELTTEGGLDVATHRERLQHAVRALTSAKIAVSAFIEPDDHAVTLAREAGCRAVEFHTGSYALATGAEVVEELARLRQASYKAKSLGLQVHAGHGLTLQNVDAITAIPEIEELNIGHALVADAVFYGLRRAVEAMKETLDRARHTSDTHSLAH